MVSTDNAPPIPEAWKLQPVLFTVRKARGTDPAEGKLVNK